MKRPDEQLVRRCQQLLAQRHTARALPARRAPRAASAPNASRPLRGGAASAPRLGR